MRDSKTCEVFARKLIRLGTVTEEEIANEAKVIDKLCNGTNPWMVKVLKHGNLTGNSLFYYIDMEYCPETLEQRIETMREHAFIKNSTLGLTTDPSRIDWDQFSKVFPMVLDIIKGVQYIHSQGLVHRDLKPRNSNLISLFN
jgi:serine/threonine protein kinase